jgi:hypothetical protein
MICRAGPPARQVRANPQPQVKLRMNTSMLGPPYLSPTLHIELRGRSVEISFEVGPGGSALWCSPWGIDPPLTRDERNAINAFVQQELARRQEWWRLAQSRRRKRFPLQQPSGGAVA